MAGWLGCCLVRRPDVRVGIRITTILDDRNEVQPDVVVWWPKPGGPLVNDDDFIVGSPQIIVEVAATSASYDLHSKKEAYRRNKVREYVVWRVRDQVIDWFRLVEGIYVSIEPDSNGIIESNRFSGLRLHVPSLFAYDRAVLTSHLRAPG
jgi:Uma2 family endonuclease